MAEGGPPGGEENPLPNGSFLRSKFKRSSEPEENELDSNQPDLGLGNQSNRKTSGDCLAGQNEVPRREENPFSFKHFLSRESVNGLSTSHPSGAKPKVFTNTTVSNNNSDTEYTRNSSARNYTTNPDLASALPDFVQDHLVVEQCFLRDAASSAHSVDLDNLPDFAVSKDASNGHSSQAFAAHNFRLRRERNQPIGIENDPLDLPSIPSPSSTNDMPSGLLPFDLPLVRDGNVCNASGNINLPGSPIQPTVSKSLPDFLSDGPIRGGHLPPADITAEANVINQNLNAEERFQAENERLREEVAMLRRQNADLCGRVQALQSKVLALEAKEHEDTSTMEKAIEQAEENLQKTMKRAVNAENMVSKLKQDIRQVQSELQKVHQENWELRGGEGGSSACDGVGASASTSRTAEQRVQMQRFAQELRGAASTAETSLRQLLLGVDNLRLLASTMETMHRVEDRTKDYISDSE